MHALIQPLSPPVFLCPLYAKQYPAAFIQLTHEEILHKKNKLLAPLMGKNIFRSRHHHSAKSTNTLATRQKEKSEITVAPPSQNLLSLFVVSHIIYFAGVLENYHLLQSLCRGIYVPPYTFLSYPPSPPIPCLLSLISLPENFSHPVIVPRQETLLWVSLFGEGLVCDCGARYASLVGRGEEEEKDLCK